MLLIIDRLRYWGIILIVSIFLSFQNREIKCCAGLSRAKKIRRYLIYINRSKGLIEWY